VLERHNVGVIVDAFTETEYRRAGARLAELLTDPSLPHRCRALARQRLSLESGVQAYHSLYRELCSTATGR
jgi:hypothetical protein